MTKRRLKWFSIIGLALALSACGRGCSLFTEIERDDAGDVSFVRQAVPKLLGRKIRGYEETRLLADAIAAIDDVAGQGRGRGEVSMALMESPEFSEHWAEMLVDMLRVNRGGDKSQSLCFGTPMRAAPDPALTDFLIQNLSGGAHQTVADFNMSDVLLASLAADNLFPIYSAYLFAMQSRPLGGNMITEVNRRDDLGVMFTQFP